VKSRFFYSLLQCPRGGTTSRKQQHPDGSPTTNSQQKKPLFVQSKNHMIDVYFFG
jgi:hypothetical protein